MSDNQHEERTRTKRSSQIETKKMTTVSHSCSYIKNGLLFCSSPACVVLVDLTEFDSLTKKLKILRVYRVPYRIVRPHYH